LSLLDNHLRRREQVERDREWDAYTADLRRGLDWPMTQELIPPGPAKCVDCGRRDLLSVSTSDGRRVILEANSDDGELAIVDGVVGPRIGGEFVFHNCRKAKGGT
jgi:hypothetical protein